MEGQSLTQVQNTRVGKGRVATMHVRKIELLVLHQINAQMGAIFKIIVPVKHEALL